MSSIKLLVALVGSAAGAAVVMLIAAAVNLSNNLGTFVSAQRTVEIEALPEATLPATVKVLPEHEIESPLDVVVQSPSDAPVMPMPTDQVEWTEVPYTDDTSGHVFTGFGSDDTEAQAEVNLMFDEMLENFAVQAQSIEANPGIR